MKQLHMPLPAVLDLTTLEFNRLLESTMRLVYSERIEAAWTAMIAAQGKDKEAMEQWVEPWNQIVNPEHTPANDMEKFISDFGAGM